MRKKIGIVFIILAVIFFALYSGTGPILKWISNPEAIEDLTADEIEINNEREAVFQWDAITAIDSLSVISTAKAINKEAIIAQMIMPELEINLPVLRGITAENLNHGVATLYDSVKLGEGNFALAGHNMGSYNVLLNRLYDMPDRPFDLYLHDKKTVYHYVVYAKLHTDQYAFYLTENAEAERHGKPIVSILTCDRPYEEDQRIFVMAELVETYDYTTPLELRPSEQTKPYRNEKS